MRPTIDELRAMDPGAMVFNGTRYEPAETALRRAEADAQRKAERARIIDAHNAHSPEAQEAQRAAKQAHQTTMAAMAEGYSPETLATVAARPSTAALHGVPSDLASHLHAELQRSFGEATDAALAQRIEAVNNQGEAPS